MARYKVLHIVPALYSGGVGSFLLNYYRGFDKDLFTFDFVTHFDEKIRVLADSLMSTSTVYYFRQQHEIGTLAYVRQYKDVIKNGNYDIVHIHNGHLTGLLAMICKIYGAKRVTCHAHTTRCMSPKLEGFMWVFRWMCRAFSNRLYACGHDAGVFCFGTDNFKIIPNGIDFNLYQRSSDEDIMRLKQTFNISQDAFVVGSVAQFTQPKNHTYLIKVFKSILEVRPNSVLLLVGDGDLKKVVEAQVEEYGIQQNVIFAGFQTEIPKFLSAFDVFLLPSIHEGLPVVAAEAQALGVKCVFSKHIDNTCDRKVGLMTFLPITDDSIIDWVTESLRTSKCLDRSDIIKHYIEDCYDLTEGTMLLQREYLELLNNI